MRWPSWGCIILLGCGTSTDREASSNMFVNEAAGYVTTEPNSTWTRSNDANAVQFVGQGKRARHSIVIRAVERPQSIAERTPSTASNLVSTTELVLRAMPGAHISKKWLVDKTELPTTEFSMTFKPVSAPGRMYERRHATLVGQKHVFHIFYTAPAGEDIDAETFDAMVVTMREEV